MNAFDYFFEHTATLEKDFLLGPRETITYAKLYTDSLKLAGYLHETIGENQNILLLSPNSVFFITAYLAILKSGNVAVPLNPETEQSNLDFIQDKCNDPLTFTTPQLTTKLNFRASALLDEKGLESLPNIEHRTPNSEYRSENLAEI